MRALLSLFTASTPRFAALWPRLGLSLLLGAGPGCVLLSDEDIAARKDVDGDGVTLEEDCDDNDASVGLPKTYTLDRDGDGFAGEEVVEACARPTGAAELTGDCDDDNPLVFPGAPDAPYDGLDADCLGEDVNGDGVPDDFDQDGDGEAASPEGNDCDDGDPLVNSAAAELCDGLDNDCDGLLDAEDPDLDPADYLIIYPDGDGDGFGVSALAEAVCSPVDGFALFGGDCDDERAAVNPDAVELCNFGIDDDCDGLVDAADPDVDESSAPEWFTDRDRDGYGVGDSLGVSCEAPAEATAPRNGDCDDGLPGVNPGALEVCDSADNDCDGWVDDADPDLDPASQSNFYADRDSDSFGDPDDVVRACAAPFGRVAFAGDCDDGNVYVNPDQREVCNGGVDDDCDGTADDLDAGLDPRTRSVFYADDDLDGYGDPAVSGSACVAPAGSANNADDCDDADPSVNPGADAEACDDGFDQNCDGIVEVCRTAASALPPDPGHFEHQGVSTRFLDDSGAPCVGHIALAMGDQAVCYVDPTGELRCAGRIYTESFGPTFVATGLTDVEQVYISPTVGPVDGNAATLVRAGEVWSLGYENSDGQLATGGYGARSSWGPWVGGTPAQRLATDFGYTYCVQDAASAVRCAGVGFGPTPTLAASSSTALIVQPAGSVTVSSSSQWRMAQGFGSCSIGPSGLLCGASGLGVPGAVVDGGETEPGSGAIARYVWLDSAGLVHTVDHYPSGGLGTATPLFTAQPVLAIAYTRASGAICGVYADGSLVCVGENEQGMLGTGDTLEVLSETVVLPPGSIDTTCD